jgi:hypothetical protein
LGVLVPGKDDAHGGAFPWIAFNFDSAAVPGDDPANNRQSQSGVLLLCCEERLSNFSDCFTRDSDSVIADLCQNEYLVVADKSVGGDPGVIINERAAGVRRRGILPRG